MKSKHLIPYVLLALAIVLYALLTPSSVSVREQPPRLTPTPVVTPTPTPTPVPTPTPTPIPIPSEYVLISKKNQNERLDAVVAIQARLRELGYYGGETDGLYGDSTFLAVVAFQRANGLKSDGLAGADTQRLLFEGENLIDSTGRVHVPFVEVTRAPTPTPTPAPPQLDMYGFSAGGELNPQLFGGTNYDDGTIRAELQRDKGVLLLRVNVKNPSQLRGALAGSYSRPLHLDLQSLCEVNNAVVGFALPDYAMRPGLFQLLQGVTLNGSVNAAKPLVTVDSRGEVRVFSAQGAQSGLAELGEDVYHAFSAQTALIINGIVQNALSTQDSARCVAFGQSDGAYWILCGAISPQDMAEMLFDQGCHNAAVIGEGGVYTCFGELTRDSYAKDAEASSILYFAALPQPGRD